MQTAEMNAANAIVMHLICDATLLIDCLLSASPSPRQSTSVADINGRRWYEESPTGLRLVPRCPAKEATAPPTAGQQDMYNFHPGLQSKRPHQDCVNDHAQCHLDRQTRVEGPTTKDPAVRSPQHRTHRCRTGERPLNVRQQ